MEKSIWIERVKNGVLHRDKEERNSLCTIQRGKANWVGHILRRNFDLKHVIGAEIEWVGRRGRRHGQVLGGHKNLKEEVLDRSLWRTDFGRGGRPVTMQTT